MTRRIVEIKETGSSYFERAIFFVRMDMPQGASEGTLTQEAARIIDRYCADLRFGRQKGRHRLNEVIKIAVSAASGAVAAVLALKLGVLL